MKKISFSLAKTPLGDLIVGLAFGKFSRTLPIKRIKETDKAVVFWHPKPCYEKHILIVPKRAIKSLAKAKENDMPYIDEIMKVTKEVVNEIGLADYSLITNGGKKQKIGQLHFHLISGKER